MLYLCQIPFEKLKVGDAVVSAINNPGVITELIDMENATQKEDNEIMIEWENGKKSLVWHFQGTQIKYMEKNWLFR